MPNISETNEILRLQTHIKELTDEAEKRSKMWAEYSTNCEVVNKLARELCEMILAKDHTQTLSGKTKTWLNMETKEMITTAKESFTKYISDTTKILKDVMRASEQRARENEQLREQITDMMRNGSSSYHSVDEVVADAERKERQKEELSKLPQKTKAAVNEGRIEVILEEDEDFDEAELNDIATYIEEGQRAKLTPTSVPISRSSKHKKAIAQKTEEVVTHLVNLADDFEQYGEVEWKIIDAIGRQGISKYKDIEAAVTNEGNILTTAVRSTITKLSEKKVLTKELISLPLSSKCAYYSLSEIGKRIYKHRFNEEPVKSEIERVVAEHDNAEHGYGILDVQAMLMTLGMYEEVSCYNRDKAITVTLYGEKMEYIPDLICKSKKGFIDYIEYERGKHNQINFNLKLDKMCKASKFLHIIVPNRETLKIVKEKVDVWIATKEKDALKPYTLRIGTAFDLKKKNGYLVEYIFREKMEPVKSVI